MNNNPIELEEEYIPEAHNTKDDNELDDVVPCDTSVFAGSQMVREETDTLMEYDELYDGKNFVNSIDLNKMVDIAPHNDMPSSEYALEEVSIPSAHNTKDDNELDDVIPIQG